MCPGRWAIVCRGASDAGFLATKWELYKRLNRYVNAQRQSDVDYGAWGPCQYQNAPLLFQVSN